MAGVSEEATRRLSRSRTGSVDTIEACYDLDPSRPLVLAAAATAVKGERG